MQVQLLAYCQHVAGLPHEGGGNKIEVLLHGELDVGAVLVGEGRQADVDAGDVDALVGGQLAAVFHGAVNAALLNFVHPQGHQAVVNENFLAGGHLLVEIRVCNGHLPLIAGGVGGRQGELVPLVELNGLGLEGFDPDFGPLGVQNGGHRTAHAVPYGFQAVQRSQMGLVGAVGKIEPGRVHTGADQGADHVHIVHRRAQGADDFCSSHV